MDACQFDSQFQQLWVCRVECKKYVRIPIVGKTHIVVLHDFFWRFCGRTIQCRYSRNVAQQEEKYYQRNGDCFHVDGLPYLHRTLRLSIFGESAAFSKYVAGGC